MSRPRLLGRASGALPGRWRPLAVAGGRGPLSLVLVVLLAGLFPTLVAAAEPSGVMPKTLRCGFLQRVFYDTDPRDAKAAIEVQGREISRSLGLNTPPQVVLFPDLPSMSTALRHGDLEMVTMPTIEYLNLRKTIPMIPAFVAANNGGLGTRYVIIARKESGIRSFADLKGKSILLPSVIKHESGQLWLEVLLMRAGKGTRDPFFRQAKESPKLFNAIMGVFLRQADAAVVTRSVLDTSRQLNPQLENQLMVVAESGNLSDGVTCLIPATPETFRNKLYREVLRLNDTSGGRQMYTIFQSSGVTPFKTQFLVGLEELVDEHNRLSGTLTKRK